MVCSIADNQPLGKLAISTGAVNTCHSPEPRLGGCIHGLPPHEGISGAMGSAIGYCQALFGASHSPTAHTQKVVDALNSINAPWNRSHELFYGYHPPHMSITDFVNQAIVPLEQGRVPILISPLDPATDKQAIEEVLDSRPAVPRGETILLRVVPRGENSLSALRDLTEGLITKARTQHAMPCWWPLIQGTMTANEWESFRHSLDANAQFTNVAINPFTSPELIDAAGEQVTVAQVVVGVSNGIHQDGTIEVPDGMSISGARPGDKYNLFAFVEQIRKLPKVPTLIILGPAQKESADDFNTHRLSKFLPLLRAGCEQLWSKVAPAMREELWQLAA